jgi:hypothetical protein
LIAATNKHMERLLGVLRQEVNPERVVTTLESRSAKVIWVHTGAKPIALRVRMIDALKTARGNAY